MTVVVMCDGASASSKAITWAAVPGYLMQQHDGEQLILLHVWSKDSLPRNTSSRENADKTPQLLNDIEAVQHLPPSIVVQKTLEVITESKVTRDTLNYKLETMVIVDSTSITTSPIPQSQPSHSHGSSKSLLAAKKEVETPPVMLSDEEIEAAAREAAEAAAQNRANNIAMYAHDRALHHNAKIILLGAGNHIEGKTITIGHVGKAMLSSMREKHPLCFIKSNGSTLRPNTLLLRYVVLLVPSQSQNNEKDNVKNLTKDCNVVKYALECCRKGTGDTVSSIVVVESKTSPDIISKYTEVLQKILHRETPTTSTVPEGLNEESNTVAISVSQEEKEETIVKETGITDTVEAEETEKVADEEEEEEQWPEVSLCELRATKQVTEPTVKNVPAQVVKFFQRNKTDIIVVPSNLPDELLLALLSMSKQHILIVPSSSTEIISH